MIEAPVPRINYFANIPNAGNGLHDKNYGLPRFSNGEFTSRFPFASVRLTDAALPVAVDITGWSPFIPNDEDNSSYPFVGLEYTFINVSQHPIEAVYYFNSFNFMKVDDHCGIRRIKNGFVFEQQGNLDEPHIEGAFCASVAEDAYVDTAWFRGQYYDTLTMLWNHITQGTIQDAQHTDGGDPGKGATLAVPFQLNPGERKTVKLRLSWYVPDSNLRTGTDDNASCCGSGGCGCGDKTKKAPLPTYKPWYTTVIHSIDDANRIWNDRYDALYTETLKFTNCFYDSTLPEEILEASSANLSILKSPTILRQTDGRLWGWEGLL